MKDNSKISDKNIFIAINRKDENVFKTFYYRYYPKLFRFIWTRTGSKELAEDLIHDIFYKIWNHSDKIDIHTSVKAYLYRTAYNQILNYRRKTKQLQEIQIEYEEKYFEDPDLKIALENALKHLPEKMRTVFILSRIEGLKYSEIAESCNIAVKTVETRMSEALKRLREALK